MRRATARRREGYEHEVEIREHRLYVDETQEGGGGDAGPRPTELLSAALATCTAITLEMYAGRKEWDLGKVEVTVEYETPCADTAPRLDVRIRSRRSSRRRAARAPAGDRRQVPGPPHTGRPGRRANDEIEPIEA